MNGLTDFISNNSEAITATVAFIALVQPWVISGYNRFIRPGHIKLYETGRIEIGYNSFGPTIGLAGTLNANHRDFFIRRIRLTVIKEKDHSQHLFEWCLFRSQKLTSGSAGKVEETAMELPFSFMLMRLQPHRYNIFFNDQGRLDEIRQVVTQVSSAWFDHRQPTPSPDYNLLTEYDSFIHTQTPVTAYGTLTKLNYWEHGIYKLAITIETDDGVSFTKDMSFSLSDEDERNLGYNPLVILQEACDQASIKYHFAYPSYQS